MEQYKDHYDEVIAIRKEAHDMVQDKVVQNMVILNRYERMDWVTYGNDGNEQTRKGAEDNLVENIKNLMEP